MQDLLPSGTFFNKPSLFILIIRKISDTGKYLYLKALPSSADLKYANSQGNGIDE
jgi:hypothetical protein